MFGFYSVITFGKEGFGEPWFPDKIEILFVSFVSLNHHQIKSQECLRQKLSIS
jgi:hypothetical protein